MLTELRGFADPKEWRGANRLGTHSSRGGAARVILEVGGSSSQLLRSGQWHSSDYEPYLDLGREESRVAASMLIEASEEE